VERWGGDFGYDCPRHDRVVLHLEAAGSVVLAVAMVLEDKLSELAPALYHAHMETLKALAVMRKIDEARSQAGTGKA
jgi:hypothetical protein